MMELCDRVVRRFSAALRPFLEAEPASAGVHLSSAKADSGTKWELDADLKVSSTRNDSGRRQGLSSAEADSMGNWGR